MKNARLIRIALASLVGLAVAAGIAWWQVNSAARMTTTGLPPLGGPFTLVDHTGRTVTQIALNWVLQRPTVATVILGARDEAQLRENLGAIGWALTPAQIAALDAASAVTPIYPYWHQRGTMGTRNPAIV